LPLVQHVVGLDVSTGLLIGHARWLSYVSEAYMLIGRVAEATGLAACALMLAGDLKIRACEAYALRLLGDLQALREPTKVAQAQASYRQALAAAEALGIRPLQAHCHRGLGLLYATTSQAEQAQAALSTAIAMYQTMEMIFWLLETEAALAQVEGR
jgi:tetratricopeptide (TPR) repeat protein